MAQAKRVMGRLIRHENGESAYRTDPSSVHAISLPFNTVDVKPDRNLITPATITGRVDAAKPAIGFTNVGGAAVIPIDQAAFGYWLQALLGPPTTTATGSAYQHVFKTNSVQNSYAYEVGYLDITEYEKFSGCKLNGMSLRVGGDEELTASFDIVGGDAAMAGTSMSSRVTTMSLSRFNQFDASLTEAGAIISTIRSLTLNVARNLDTGVYLVTSGSSGKRGALPEGFCNVTGEMEMTFENRSYYLKAMSGTETSLALRFQTGSFYLLFEVNEMNLRWTGPGISTPGGIYLTLPFEAYYDNASPDETIIQATLVNTWSAYSGHL